MKIAFLSFGAEYSERLPGKNYKILCGKELCRYTFDFIKQYFPDYPYYVFTDSEIIERIAKEYNFNIVKCSKESRDGVNGTILVQNTIKAGCYFKLPFTSPIRHIENVKSNMNICLNNDNIHFAFTANFKNNIINPKPTGSMWFWRPIRTDNSERYVFTLPDWYDFDIDYLKDFDEVEKYLQENKCGY